jgi:hypothetical protein
VPVDGKRLHDHSYNPLMPTERLRPLRDQLILEVLPLKLSATIEAAFQGDTVRGKVIAAGPGTWPNRHYRGTRDGKPWRTIKPSAQFRPTEVKVGDVVQLGGMELGGYLWPKVFIDGKECAICTEKDVAVIEEGAHE